VKPKPTSAEKAKPAPKAARASASERTIPVGHKAFDTFFPPVVATDSTSRAEQVWELTLLVLLSMCFLLALAPRRLAASGSFGRSIVTARFGFLAIGVGVLFVLTAPLLGEVLK
jgi:hypothetical protein